MLAVEAVSNYVGCRSRISIVVTILRYTCIVYTLKCSLHLVDDKNLETVQPPEDDGFLAPFICFSCPWAFIFLFFFLSVEGEWGNKTEWESFQLRE